MGSEQSHPTGAAGTSTADGSRRIPPTRIPANSNNRLQRGNTIAVSEVNKRFQDDISINSSDSRPVSPPISVCSDSDIPYVSYTDRPIGDSPKIRNKGPINNRNARSNSITSSNSSSSKKPAVNAKQRPQSSGHAIVVVKPGNRDYGPEKDPEILRLQNIPMFLPVMRSTLSLPSSRDPEILDRLQPVHLQNICSRLQIHYNLCATQIATEQGQVMAKIKEVDHTVAKLYSSYAERQRTYTSYCEQFGKIRTISQQLIRCNSMLNHMIESMETLNNFLEIEDRLEPFVWKTE